MRAGTTKIKPLAKSLVLVSSRAGRGGFLTEDFLTDEALLALRGIFSSAVIIVSEKLACRNVMHPRSENQWPIDLLN
jgi:hypothetical protein